MLLHLERNGSSVVARLAGEIDLDVADDLRLALDNALKPDEVRHLILNLSEVSFIDSSGLGVILGRYRKLVHMGGKVSLVDPKPQVRRILELSGLFSIIGEFKSETEALTKIV